MCSHSVLRAIFCSVSVWLVKLWTNRVVRTAAAGLGWRVQCSCSTTPYLHLLLPQSTVILQKSACPHWASPAEVCLAHIGQVLVECTHLHKQLREPLLCGLSTALSAAHPRAHSWETSDKSEGLDASSGGHADQSSSRILTLILSSLYRGQGSPILKSYSLENTCRNKCVPFTLSPVLHSTSPPC